MEILVLYPVTSFSEVPSTTNSRSPPNPGLSKIFPSFLVNQRWGSNWITDDKYNLQNEPYLFFINYTSSNVHLFDGFAFILTCGINSPLAISWSFFCGWISDAKPRQLKIRYINRYIMIDILFKFILKPFIGKFRCFLWFSPVLRAWDPNEYFVRFRQIDGVGKWKDNCLLI